MHTQTITLYDNLQHKTQEAKLRPTLKHNSATIGHALFETHDEYGSYSYAVPTIIYPDGTTFCADDWDAGAPLDDLEDISNISWYDNATGQPAIIYDGLPKTLT